MKFTEQQGDLFSLTSSNQPERTFICHCVSADFALGAGFAKTIINRYPETRAQLDRISQNQRFIGLSVTTSTNFSNLAIANLITKQRYFNKPTYDTVKASLLNLRKQVLQYDVKHLYMPRIASGLDRLDWPQVRDIIQSVFRNDDVVISVLYL